ncbi:uncharacterized protein LOC113871910 [Abrus precatorius]|uniref:Uncharacterized protein LOC113871910 n=1 Tax=Abrus precatorius TaxID=3816 RepID=A0A8B8MA12_ABRPR|nr:uncharacterized protein LOC113871910 [Abrus precatorius]
MEKHVVQIFERTKRIIDQSRQQCHLWEHHLFPKLLLNGIPPPPWLCNSSLHTRPSDPQELNKDELLSEVLLSQPQVGVPLAGHHCNLYSNLDAVSDGVQYPIGLHDEGCDLIKDCNTGDGLSIVPDCSVNNTGCASSGPPELDFGAESPQNQLEPRVSGCHHDPALSLAKLQRSKSRQKALELRNSARAPKRWSRDDSNAGVCAGTVTGSTSSTPQAEHLMESDWVKDFRSNIQSCSMEEMARRDCVTQEDKSNYSGRITRSKRFQRLNSSNNASSSEWEEDGPLPYDLNESLEIVNRCCAITGGCGVKEANEGEYQRREAGRREKKRLTKSRSSSQARCIKESFKIDNTLSRGKRTEICDLMQPITHVDQTHLSKASDCNDGSRRNTINDRDFILNKQESNIHVKSIDKSAQSNELLISQNSQNVAEPVVGSFGSQKDPDFAVVKTKDCLSRSCLGKEYITRDPESQNHPEEVLDSSRSNSCVQNAACSESAGKRSQNLQPTEMVARRSSSSPKYSKLDIEIARNSAEEEKAATLTTFRNTRAVTTCAKEGSLIPVSSSNLDGKSLLAESVYIETAVDGEVTNTQENILSGTIPNDNVKQRSAATGEVDAYCDGSVEKDSSVSPKVGLNVSVLKLPSDVVMSVMPKQLDFDDVEETSMNVICSPDLKEGQRGMSPEEEPLNSLEPVNLVEEETSLVHQSKHKSLGEMHSMEMQEVLIREEEPQMKYCENHFEEEDLTSSALNAMSPIKELPMVQNDFCILSSSLMNHSTPSQVASENSSGSLSKEALTSKFVLVKGKLKDDGRSTGLADSSSEAVSGNGLHKYTDKNITNITVGFPFAAPMDDMNAGLALQGQNSIFSAQEGGLLGNALLSDGKITGSLNYFQLSKSSTESFTYDVERHHKRRKTEIETHKFLPATSNLLEKPLDSTDQRPKSRNLSIEEDIPRIVLEVQHLACNQEDDTRHQFVSNSDEIQNNRKCQTMEGSSLKARREEKLILDGRDRCADTLLLEEANMSGFVMDSTLRCSMDEKMDSWHRQVICGEESAELLACVERNNSSRRIYPGGNPKFSDGVPLSPGIQCLDSIGTDETLPEFEGFIMQTDKAQPCIAEDQIELEKMNLPSNSIDYTSHGKSRSMHSPMCYSSTPYKLHNIPEFCQSLPNGLLEGIGQRTSLPLNNGSPRSLSDGQPNCMGHYTSSVQTLWDRINSNFGSSGKRKSLKLELPCISEENETVDEIAGNLQRGIRSEGMTSSITREPLVEIIDNPNPSTSILQDDVLTGGREDCISTEFNLSGTRNKVKNNVDKQNGNRRRFMSKGKENQSISLGANGAKRTTESVCKRPSRPKLSGKDSMKRGTTYSEVKSTCNNIVSNISSFIPLVQQKQAAVGLTGKRDIKVKALEAAEAAKRMAERKENERKMKKEALRLEREKLEQQNLRQLELQKKKKEEERKKKDVQMAAKKRQREDEEKKEKERKRKRVNDTKKQQLEHEKIHAKKEEREIQGRATGEGIQENKKFMDAGENHKNLQEQDKREGNLEKISETESLAIRNSEVHITKENCPEYLETVNDCVNDVKVMSTSIKATEDDDLIIKNSLQEQAYEISPYKGSDDEDEDEDGIPNNKFIPSWASKRSLSLIVSSQKIDPETIFPPQSFCTIAEDF